MIFGVYAHSSQIAMAPVDATQASRIRVLGLHGFRTSGAILKRQLELSTLSDRLSATVDFHCIDAPHPAVGPPDETVQKTFPGLPYYEWWNAITDDQGEVEYRGWPETLTFVQNYMRTHGPFDGLFGFSQGANLAGVIVGLQQNGLAFGDIPPIRFCVLAGGMRSRYKVHKPAFSEPISCPSLHLIGEKDRIGPLATKLVGVFRSPVVIRHPGGHVVPKLEGEEAERVDAFFNAVGQEAKC